MLLIVAVSAEWPNNGVPNVPAHRLKNIIFYYFFTQVRFFCLRAAVSVCKSVHGKIISGQYIDGTINPALLGETDQIRCVNNSKCIFHGFIIRAASSIHARSFGAIRQCALYMSCYIDRLIFLEY
jgi:hypothetical protein